MKKFELTSETKIFFGRTLFRIKALTSFGNVKAGELGGWIEKESNLSQDGNAWVCGSARVYGNAWVCGNAEVYGNAWVCGSARVYDSAEVCDNARVCGNAEVCDNARVCGNALVCGSARVYGSAEVYGNAEVCDNARVCGNAEVLWISKIGSRLGTTTFFRSKLGIEVSCGCFLGTLEQFAEKVEQTHGDSKYGKQYKLAIELAKLSLAEEKDEGSSQNVKN